MTENKFLDHNLGFSLGEKERQETEINKTLTFTQHRKDETMRKKRKEKLTRKNEEERLKKMYIGTYKIH